MDIPYLSNKGAITQPAEKYTLLRIARAFNIENIFFIIIILAFFIYPADQVPGFCCIKHQRHLDLWLKLYHKIV
jgi:hypothetical protein